MTNSKNTYLLAEIPKNPNDILSEMMLMEEIDASRTPIREALNSPDHSQKGDHGPAADHERDRHDL